MFKRFLSSAASKWILVVAAVCLLAFVLVQDRVLAVLVMSIPSTAFLVAVN